MQALVDRFAAVGIRPVLKHAATALGVVSTYAMGVDPDPAAGIRVTAGGEAAHPSAEVSLTKALLEYANSRSRKAFCFGDREAARRVAPGRVLGLPRRARTGRAPGVRGDVGLAGPAVCRRCAS